MKLTKMKKQMILGAVVMLSMHIAQPLFAEDAAPSYEDSATGIADANAVAETAQQKIQKEYDVALKKLTSQVSASKNTLDSLVERPLLSTNYTTANFIHYLDTEGLYSENTRAYYVSGYQGRSLDEEFVDLAHESQESVGTLYRALNAVKIKAGEQVVSINEGSAEGKNLHNFLLDAGLMRVTGDERTEYYPKKAWNRILSELDVSHSGRVRNLGDIGRLYGLVSEDSGITKVDKIGRTVRFVKDGVTYTYNCDTERLTRISGSEKIKETASKSHGVFWNILKGTMLTLATGAEIYRPFLTAKTNDKFLNGWEDVSLKSLDYGFPIPPYPVLQPIYPVNLTGIFKLWGMDEEQSSYDRSMAWFNQSPFMQSYAMSMNPMAMNMAMQMQMRQRMMNPWGGQQGQGGPWGQQQNPGGGINVDWNQVLAPLQYQTFAMSNAMSKMNEEITIRRQQAENSINNLRSLEAATGAYQRLIPDLMGVLNKMQTAQGQLNGANNRAQNSMSNVDYSVQYRRDGGAFNGGFGGGNNPYAQGGW